ncbi:MAG: ATP-grasp domain-containing protein [Pseudomonadota bacterium]
MVTIDGFADIDTLEVSLESWCLPLEDGKFGKYKLFASLDRLQFKFPQAKVLLGAGAEYLADYITDGWSLCNSLEAMKQVVQPSKFFTALDKVGIPHPDISFNQNKPSEDWLYKQTLACGGWGVTRNKSSSIGYWQKEITGQPISALCIADHDSVQIIGINKQLTQSMAEQLPYVYLGAVANHQITIEISIKIETYINKLRDKFRIIGVFSLDMILSVEDLYVLEINPRISASFELYEQVNPGLNLVDAHIRVCEGERLSKLDLSEEHCGYQIIYADNNLVIPQHMNWPKWIKDKPESNRAVQQYEPICSVYAHGAEDEIPALINNRAKDILIQLYQ